MKSAYQIDLDIGYDIMKKTNFYVFLCGISVFHALLAQPTPLSQCRSNSTFSSELSLSGRHTVAQGALKIDSDEHTDA
jgi:hypothetical protein